MTLLPADSIGGICSKLDLEAIRKICRDRKWGDLGGRLAISPFEPTQAQWMSYDLTAGREIYYLRRAQRIELKDKQEFQIEPGETVLVLIEEYVALGPDIAGVIIGKTSLMNQGLVQPTTRIDPTWHGRFPIPLTNHSTKIVKLLQGQAFCTCVFANLATPLPSTRWLDNNQVKHLGSMGLALAAKDSEQWHPRPKDKVNLEDLDDIPATFGPPFDRIVGGIVKAKSQALQEMTTEWGPGAMEEIKQALVEEQIRSLKDLHESQLALLKDQQTAQMSILNAQLEEARRSGERQVTLSAEYHKAQLALLTDQITETKRFGRSTTWTLVFVVLGWLAAMAVLILKPTLGAESDRTPPLEPSKTPAGSLAPSPQSPK